MYVWNVRIGMYMHIIMSVHLNLCDCMHMCIYIQNLNDRACAYVCVQIHSVSYDAFGGRNSSVGSAWARCPQRRGFNPPLGTFSVEGIFPLELTWVQTPFP